MTVTLLSRAGAGWRTYTRIAVTTTIAPPIPATAHHLWYQRLRPGMPGGIGCRGDSWCIVSLTIGYALRSTSILAAFSNVVSTKRTKSRYRGCVIRTAWVPTGSDIGARGD